MKKLLSAAVFAAVAGLFAQGAQANPYDRNWDYTCGCEGSPLTGSFAVSIWNASTPGATITSASQQALPTNPIATSANLISTGVYKGNLEMSYDPSHGTPTVAGFLASGGGTYTGTGNTNVLISSGGFATATLIEFSFTTSATLTGISISHDDGVSLFAANNPSVNLIPGASAPTTDANATLATLAAGTYNLWYEEANGVPAILCFDPVNGGTATVPTATPEPASMALLGAGLAGIGFVRRRRAA